MPNQSPYQSIQSMFPPAPCLSPECQAAQSFPASSNIDVFPQAAPLFTGQIPQPINTNMINNGATGNPQDNTANANFQSIQPNNQPVSITANNIQYMNGFMRTQIGRRVLVEFLIGTNTLVDRTGILLAVGANYILINETDTDDILMCDYYNIKFVKFFY